MGAADQGEGHGLELERAELLNLYGVGEGRGFNTPALSLSSFLFVR
jgi:hypothetical protein